jgi:hypothetical protein
MKWARNCLADRDCLEPAAVSGSWTAQIQVNTAGGKKRGSNVGLGLREVWAHQPAPIHWSQNPIASAYVRGDVAKIRKQNALHINDQGPADLTFAVPRPQLWRVQVIPSVRLEASRETRARQALCW